MIHGNTDNLWTWCGELTALCSWSRELSETECIACLRAEVERLRAALEEIVSLGTIESIQQTRIAEGALRGEGEK